MTRMQSILIGRPVDRAVELVEVQELIEASDPSFRYITGVVDVEAINCRIEARLGTTSETVKILNPEPLTRLFKQRVVVQRKEMCSS